MHHHGVGSHKHIALAQRSCIAFGLAQGGLPGHLMGGHRMVEMLVDIDIDKVEGEAQFAQQLTAAGRLGGQEEVRVQRRGCFLAGSFCFMEVIWPSLKSATTLSLPNWSYHIQRPCFLPSAKEPVSSGLPAEL